MFHLYRTEQPQSLQHSWEGEKKNPYCPFHTSAQINMLTTQEVHEIILVLLSMISPGES